MPIVISTAKGLTVLPNCVPGEDPRPEEQAVRYGDEQDDRKRQGDRPLVAGTPSC